MQGCQLVDSHKNPVSSPSKKTKNTNQKTKATKQTKNTQQQQKTKTKTPKKKPRSGIATSYGNNVHNDILCVMMRMAIENQAKQRKHRTTQRGQVRG